MSSFAKQIYRSSFAFIIASTIPSLSFASGPLEDAGDPNQYLQAIEYEEFVRLPADKRAEYIEVLRETVVELAANERGSKYEFWNGSDRRFSSQLTGWRAGYYVIMQAFTGKAFAESQIEMSLPESPLMTEAQYEAEKVKIQKKFISGGRNGPAAAEKKRQEELAAHEARWRREKPLREAKAAEEKAMSEAAKAEFERTYPAKYKALEAQKQVRAGRGYAPADAQTVENVNAQLSDLEKQRKAILGEPAKADAKPAGAGNPEKTRSMREALEKEFKKRSAPECLHKIPTCPNPKTRAGQDAINEAAKTARAGSGCLYGGFKRGRVNQSPNKETESKPGNCESKSSVKFEGATTVSCAKRNEVLCNPMLFGVEDALDASKPISETMTGVCVPRTKTVTGDCNIKFRSRKAAKGAVQFWDLKVPGSDAYFNPLVNDLNDTCNSDAIRTFQCNECMIIQSRLASTRKIKGCSSKLPGGSATGGTATGGKSGTAPR